MARQATKQLGVKTIKSLNVGFYGNEPVYQREVTAREVTDALNWYNYNMDDKDGVNFLHTYLANQGRNDLAKIVKAVGERCFSPTTMKLARMVNLGAILPPVAIEWMEKGLADGLDKYERIKSEKVVKYEAPKKLNEKNVTLLNPIEDAILARNSKFDLGKYLTTNSVTQETASKIAKFYEEELNAAKKMKPDDYVTQQDIDAHVKYLDKIVIAAKTFAGIPLTTEAKVRKPRTKKVIPPEKKVAGMKFAKEFADYNIKSINPADIIGKQSLWVYDFKNVKLTHFKAENEKGLDVKGTTIINYSEALSESKRVGRKAKEIVPSVLSGGKVYLRKLLSTINTGKLPLTGRISENVVLLRVEK